MTVKWIGAILIICACGGFGFHLSSMQKKEEAMLRELMSVFEYISCELECRLTPLPQLCRMVSENCTGKLKGVLTLFAKELEFQISPDASICMTTALGQYTGIPESAKQLLSQLSSSFGRFDLDGQLREISSLRTACSEILKDLTENKDKRHRTYHTLGLCVGAALAILFI